MKILLISGHGAGDPGAIGNGYKEADLTVEVVKGIKPLLEKYATVDVYPYERNAFKDIQNGNLQVNFANYNYVFEVHFNAFNGAAKGTEIYVTSKEKGTTVEQKIMKNLGAYFSIRGANGVMVTDFLVIKTAKNKGASSALLETCFIDNAEDMKSFQNNKAAIYKAIVDGIVDGFGLKKNEPVVPQKSIEDIAKEVIAGKWGNGTERKERLEKAGYNYTEVQKKVNQLLK